MLLGNKLKLIDLFIVACLYFATYVSIQSFVLNKIALYVVLPFAFILAFFRQGHSIKISNSLGILLLLIAWIFISYLWATDKQIASEQLNELLGTIIICFIFSVVGRNRSAIPLLYVTYIICYVAMWQYAQNNLIAEMTEETSRLSDKNLNANSMAYILFYVTFSIYILSDILKRESIKKILRVLFLGLIPLSFSVALLTASRQVLIIQIPLISVLLYMRYIRHNSSTKRMVFIFFASIVCVILMPKALDKYSNSYLKARSETELKEDSRYAFAIDAIKVGFYHPFGVGPANYARFNSINGKSFSHNSYAEIFANEGVIGLLLYLWLMWAFLKTQWSRYRKTKDDMFMLFLIFGVFYIVDGVFYVFINSMWLMGVFILVATHSDTYYREKYIDRCTPCKIQ